MRLERLCRDLLRPPLAQERLKRRADGRILVELRKAWRDGTTHLLLEPLELLEKLAALTPRPEAHLLLYHGVLAPHAAWRRRVVGFGRPQENADADASSGEPGATGRPRYQAWAALMQRAFGLDVLVCPRCGLRLLASISDPAVVEQIARLFARVGQSKQVTAKAQIELFGAALDQYRLDIGAYPPGSVGLEALVRNPNFANWNGPTRLP